MRGLKPFVLVSGSLLCGCLGPLDGSLPPSSVGDVDAGPAPSTETDFDRATMEIATSYKTFSRINNNAYLSALSTSNINLYVHDDARDYRTVHPELTGSNVTIAVGTVIVREVLDPQGQVAKLTIMAKGPSGYDPSLGDWWFGEADPQGTPLVVDGAVRLGRLADCHSCHIPRATDDYVFGVPKADQSHH